MKKLVIAAISVAAILGGATYAAHSNPNIGARTLAIGGEFEAKLRGFTEHTVMAAGIAHRMYQGGDASKPTIVLLHGYSADKDVWPRFATHLVKDFHIVIPDMAGHGETGFKPEWNYTVPAQADRIIALMDAMGVKRFHVVGNSMGGMISATLALKYPNRVTTSTAIDPAGVHSPEPSKMDKMVAVGRNPFEVSSYDQFREFYGMTMAKPPYLPEFILRGMAQTYQLRREELAEIFRQFRGKDMLDDHLSQISRPLLLIWGDKDELLDVSSVAVWKAKAPGIQTHVFKDIGHMPMVEIPEQTATLVKAFIHKQNSF